MLHSASLVIFYLAILHLVPYKGMREQWRYVYGGLMILSAVVTQMHLSHYDFDVCSSYPAVRSCSGCCSIIARDGRSCS